MAIGVVGRSVDRLAFEAVVGTIVEFDVLDENGVEAVVEMFGRDIVVNMSENEHLQRDAGHELRLQIIVQNSCILRLVDHCPIALQNSCFLVVVACAVGVHIQ